MRYFDFQCPGCGRIEVDVLVRFGHAVEVDCIECPAFPDGRVAMRRLFNAVPQVWHTGGRGGQA